MTNGQWLMRTVPMCDRTWKSWQAQERESQVTLSTTRNWRFRISFFCEKKVVWAWAAWMKTYFRTNKFIENRSHTSVFSCLQLFWVWNKLECIASFGAHLRISLLNFVRNRKPLAKAYRVMVINNHQRWSWWLDFFPIAWNGCRQNTKTAKN
jgi:hypothetical protein